MEKATFGAGCFWHVEEAFRHVPGVSSTAVGFMGGSTKEPSYKEVCTGRTGHAEVVFIEYDPEVISYDDLLKIFWEVHDPTSLNRQGPDIGHQYRSVIFYYSDGQKEKAGASKEALRGSGKYGSNIVTEIVPAMDFFMAEEYHQQYLEKRGLSRCII